MQEKKIRLWSMPKEGYLSGKILSVQTETFTLQDFHQKIWMIRFEDAFFPPMVQIEPGEQVKMTGKMTGADTFNAEQIRPWGGMGQHRGGGPIRGN